VHSCLGYALLSAGNINREWGVKRVISIPLEAGGTADLEIEDNVTSPVMRGGVQQTVIERAVGSFEAAVAKVKPVAAAVVGQFVDVVHGTTEVKVKFGLKFNAEAGVVIASAGSEANFEIEVSWTQHSSA
jgi:hypothetical protein